MVWGGAQALGFINSTQVILKCSQRLRSLIQWYQGWVYGRQKRPVRKEATVQVRDPSICNEDREKEAMFKRYFRKQNYIKLGGQILRVIEKKASKMTVVFHLVDQAEWMMVP